MTRHHVAKPPILQPCISCNKVRFPVLCCIRCTPGMIAASQNDLESASPRTLSLKSYLSLASAPPGTQSSSANILVHVPVNRYADDASSRGKATHFVTSHCFQKSVSPRNLLNKSCVPFSLQNVASASIQVKTTPPTWHRSRAGPTQQAAPDV